MKPTAKQIAHIAGVSVSAVSRAFTPDASIDPKKKERILRTAAELGYVSPARRTAEAMAADTVTLVAGDLLNPFYPMVLDTLAKELLASGQRLLVHALPAGADIDTLTEHIVAARPRALIVTSAMLTSAIAAACQKHGIQIVLFNRTQRDVWSSSITCDNYGGGRDVARYLLDRGFRRIAFVKGTVNTSTHRDRERGFYEVMREAGHAVHAAIEGDFHYDRAFSAVGAMLEDGKPPEAVFCCNDIMALAAIDAARAKGLTPGEDLAVVGFDDIPMASWRSYRLTTIRQPVRQMVAELLNLIRPEAAFDREYKTIRTIPGRLIIRASA